MTSATRSNHLIQGALLILLGECLLAIMGALIKHLSAELPTELIGLKRHVRVLFCDWQHAIGGSIFSETHHPVLHAHCGGSLAWGEHSP